ncbi:MAG TPA: M23 family metallopeptidase [bacterium]|nr:M23 family metallopeptidase [bacterium]
MRACRGIQTPSPHLSKLGIIFAVASACVSLAASQTTVSQRSITGTEEEYIAAGIFETGLTAEMPEDANCPVIASGFADRYNRSGRLRSEYAQWLFHAGVDWGLPEGTPIVAIADGRVIARQIDEPGSELGNHVIIRHYPRRDDISASYVHLSGFNVDVNQEVKLGQVIGFVGKTGKGVTYSHLHLNIYGRQQTQLGNRKIRYRYDFLQLLSGDMTPIDPVKKRNQKVKVAYMDQFGKVHPPGAKVIWPFICERKVEEKGTGY